MSDPDMLEQTSPFELYGEWWKEGSDQEKRVPGCLSYTPDYGLQLQLYGGFPHESSWTVKEEDSPGIIFGEVFGFASKRVKTSLLSPICTNRANDPGAPDKPAPHAIFFINRAIFGAHVTDTTSLSLASIRFSVSDLERFANTKPVSVLPQGSGVTAACVTEKRPVETLQDPRMQVELATLVGCSSSLYDRNCIISYRDEIILTPTTPLQLDVCTQIVFSMTNFLLICRRDGVKLRYFKGVLESGEEISVFGNTKGRKNRITPCDWILTLNQIGGRFHSVLEHWFALLKKLGFFGPVLFSELAEPSQIQDARFFHFAGCLEAFHREVVQAKMGKYLTQNEYREIAQSLLATVPPTLPEGLRLAMRSALSHANDHSFAERLDALFNTLEPETQHLLTVEPGRFLAAIKHSRNKLAHVTAGTSGETFEGDEFAHANLSIRAWLTILLLRECDIPESRVRERLVETNYFYWGPFKFEARTSVEVGQA